jgi:hypothetical protein
MNMPQSPSKQLDGDELFLGVDLRDARTLAPALLNDARNLRFTDFVPQTRKGVIKPGWANRVDATASDVINAWGTIYGAGTFRDPDSRAWGLLAADGGAYRLLPYNQAVSIALPTGVRLLGPVTFCQAFDNVYCFRGRFLAPLRMTDFDTGWEDIVTHWDSSAATAVNGEVAYGPFQDVDTMTSAGNTVTVVTAVPHGYITGADITHMGANQSPYNVRANITVIDELTYTFPFAGSGTSPATGTIKASNMIQYWKALGTLLTLTTLTSSSTTATATKTAHGFTTGQSVTIAGASPSAYNGTYVITVTDVDHFTYTFAGGTTPATGTITARNNAVTVAGHSPDTNPNDWTRVWNILPNADNALYINNRMLVPTAYEPSSADNYATFNGGSYKKKDYVVATDYLDDVHFDFSNEFRINQGSADEIVDLAKFNESTVVVWKDASWGVLSNVAFSLTQLSLDFRNTEYGLAARGAWTLAGSDLYFTATKRGVVSVRQSENGKLIGVDLPLSAPIQRLIDRIDWTLGEGIRMANWDSKLYCAVPMSDGVQLDTTRIVVSGAGDAIMDGTYVQTTAAALHLGGTEPVLYALENGNLIFRPLGGSDWRMSTQDGEGGVLYSAPQPTGPWSIVRGNSYGATPPAPAAAYPTATATRNTILVYDLVAAAKGNTNLLTVYGWTPRDTGSAICPVEFFKMPLDRQERLFFAGADGFVNLMEESYDGDEISMPGTTSGLGREPIACYALTRAYLKTDTRLSKPVNGSLVIQTLAPNYSANMIFSGVNKKTVLATDETRDNTRYFRPWDAAAWDPTNTNDDHDTPDREDYSIDLPAGGLSLGAGGVQVDRFQEVIHNLRLNGRQGRSFQVEVTNTAGRIKLLAVVMETTTGRERKGKLT